MLPVVRDALGLTPVLLQLAVHVGVKIQSNALGMTEK
jgi:hypothetical protein